MSVPGDPRVHRADGSAFPAADAARSIHSDTEERHPVPKPVPKTEGTKETAEGTVNARRHEQHRRQQNALPNGEPTRRREICGAERHERKRALQHPGGADIGAEKRLSYARGKKRGDGTEDNQGQHRPAKPRKGTHPGSFGELRHGEAMQDILHETEGAKPTADEAPEKKPEEQQQTRHIKREARHGSAPRALPRTDGTRPQRPGTGIAVEPRHAGGLHRTAIEPSRQPARKIAVGCDRGNRLHEPSPNQGRYTPDRSAPPSPAPRAAPRAKAPPL